jgi:hypothetical protein
MFMEVTVSYQKEDWVSGLGCQIGEDRLTYGTRVLSDMGRISSHMALFGG